MWTEKRITLTIFSNHNSLLFFISATDALQQFEADEVKTTDVTKSPRMRRSPLVVNSETEEMEFVSVGRKSRMPPTGGDGGQRIVWSSMQSNSTYDKTRRA